MVNADNVTFPVSLETFVALQRAEMDRDFTATEMELFTDIVDMANESYKAACDGDADTVQVLLDTINSADTDDPYTRHVAGLCRGWVLLGCRRGAEQLKMLIDNGPIS